MQAQPEILELQMTLFEWAIWHLPSVLFIVGLVSVCTLIYATLMAWR